MPRRALLWLCGLALVVGALLLTDRLLWKPGMTAANVRRIRPGMTLAEVEALLGGPATERMEMPADCPAYRWHRKRRNGAAWAEVSFWADGPVMTGGGRGQPPPGPATSQTSSVLSVLPLTSRAPSAKTTGRVPRPGRRKRARTR
jgi:hypothetical protein